MKFNELGLIAPILSALETEGYTQPTPIQEQSIPILLQRKDLLGCAQTGTGKTAAFAIPILQLLHEDHAERKHRHIKVLVLTPTRELAIQIEESFKAYGRNLPIKHTVIFGGVTQGSQVQALKRGVDVLVATPGRLLDLMNQGHVSLKDISIFVLDEADRMLDMGFIHDVKRVVATLPQKRQNVFFSATMPPDVQKLANTILVKPEMVSVTPPATTAELVDQSVYFVDKKDKKQLLHLVLEDPAIRSALVFTRTKHGADKVVKDLVKANFTAEAIHGNKSQNARQRALSNFKDGKIRVLVATDIAARGIDVDLLSHVINYEIPEVPETYVHRIGRTGRAGASGIAISFCDNEEMQDWRNILKITSQKIPVVENHPFPLAGSGMVKINPPKGKDVVPRPNAIPGNGQRNNNNRNDNRSGNRSNNEGRGQGRNNNESRGNRTEGENRDRNRNNGNNSRSNNNDRTNNIAVAKSSDGTREARSENRQNNNRNADRKRPETKTSPKPNHDSYTDPGRQASHHKEDSNWASKSKNSSNDDLSW